MYVFHKWLRYQIENSILMDCTLLPFTSWFLCLIGRFLHKRPQKKGGSGPPTILTVAEEERLVQYCIDMGKIGYGKTKREVSAIVQAIVKEDGRETPCKDRIPGQKWWEGFMRRHKEVSWCKAELLGKECVILAPAKADIWFRELEEYLVGEVKEGASIMKDGSRIFNADEIDFPLLGKTDKVLAPKGSKDIYQQGTSNKTQITVLACASGDGTILPPMTIHPGVHLKYDPTEGVPEGTCLGRTPSGWIDSATFYEWIANHFEPFLQSNGMKKPVLLLVDGHTSHINLDTSDICNAHDIILYCLPPHATLILQPLDDSVFKGLKSRWFAAVRNFQSLHVGEFVSKSKFCRSLFTGLGCSCLGS